MKTALVVAVVGGKSKLAALLQITPSAVSQWGECVPKLRQYELREAWPSIDRDLESLSGARVARCRKSAKSRVKALCHVSDRS